MFSANLRQPLILSARDFPDAFLPTIRFFAPRLKPFMLHSWGLPLCSMYSIDSRRILHSTWLYFDNNYKILHTKLFYIILPINNCVIVCINC